MSLRLAAMVCCLRHHVHPVQPEEFSGSSARTIELVDELLQEAGPLCPGCSDGNTGLMVSW